MDDPTLWAGIWLAVAIAFAGAEIMIAGSFFLLPFAVGAVVAAVASLFTAPLVVSWGIFLVVSFAAFLALRPLSKRLAERNPDVEGVGANRLVGTTGTILKTIPADTSEAGRIRLGTEEWIANTDGIYLPEGARATVVEIRGTQAIVRPS